jgi:single-stranded DNA-binding protein
MNQFCLVGRIAALPVLEKAANGWNSCMVLIQVPRPYANSKGVVESDLIKLQVWRGAAETLAATARINTWISAKGRIQSKEHEIHGKKVTVYTMIAEKIEFIH